MISQWPDYIRKKFMNEIELVLIVQLFGYFFMHLIISVFKKKKKITSYDS